MLNKNDLAKQFELVVKQEIINHNNQILMSNQSLNEMREFQQSKEEKQTQINFKLSTSLDKTFEDSKQIEKALKDFSFRTLNTFQECFTLLDKLSLIVNSSNQDCVESKVNLEKLDSKVSDLEIKIYRLDKLISDFSISLNEYETKLTNRIESKLEKLKLEINNMPSEALQVKDDLSKIMDVDRIDSKGIQEWIKKVHQCNFVNEKKIENIYTLIERLNTKIG